MRLSQASLLSFLLLLLLLLPTPSLPSPTKGVSRDTSLTSPSPSLSLSPSSSPFPYTSPSPLPSSSPSESPADVGEGECVRKIEYKYLYPNATSSDFCQFVANNCDQDTLLPYVHWFYCHGVDPIASYTLFVIWIVVLFYLLGKAADDYFCPTLQEIADYLNMSDAVAGMTILALGNGSPDVSSSIISIRNGDYGIAIGELLGAGLFVCCVVVAVVGLVSDVELERFSFFRDILFYLVGASFLAFILWLEKIYWFLAIIPLIYYLVYVSGSVGYHYWAIRRRDERNAHTEVGFVGFASALSSKVNEDTEKQALLDTISTLDADDSEGEESWSWRWWLNKWNGKSTFKKIYYVLTMPMWSSLYLTTPDLEKWNRIQCLTIPILSPILFMLAFNSITLIIPVGSYGIPVVLIAMVGGLAIGLLLFFTSNNTVRPKYKLLFVVYGFIMCVLWIYLVANEVVGLLGAIGLLLQIPSVILGATVLAWGNSLGDLVSNSLLARQGAPRMAIAACFAGPGFNLLFGLGLSLAIQTFSTLPTPFLALPSHLYYVTHAFLIVALLSSLIYIPLFADFKITKPFAIYLIVIYAIYNVLALLISLGLLWPDVVV